MQATRSPDDYAEFLAAKSQQTSASGFEPLWMPGQMFPFQSFLTGWSIRMGRSGLFEDCGTGKSVQELTWAQNVYLHTGRPVLLLTRLGVAFQMASEAAKFGIEAVVSRDGTLPAPVTITNYEQLGKYDPSLLGGVVCDESSAIKSLDSATRSAVTEFLRTVPYRLLGTATPDPNSNTELGTSSEALGYLGHMDMLARFFTNKDKTSKAMGGRWRSRAGDEWRFKGHAEEPFWRWIASWARAMRKPSDLGFSDEGFDVPPLETRRHIVQARTAREGTLFDVPAVGLSEEREEVKRTITERCEMAASILADASPGIAWCLPPTGPVRMADGTERPISKVIPGDRVLSGAGIPRQVGARLRREHDGEIVRVKTRGLCDTLELTPEHRLPTASGWVAAGSLACGDYLLEPRIGLTEGGDYEAGWLTGVYAAQGNRVRGPRGTWNRIDLTVHELKAPAIADRVRTWSAAPVYRYPTRGHAVRVCVSSRVVRDLVDRWVAGELAVTKRLTDLPVEREFAKGLLDGWLEEDGSKSKTPSSRIGQTSSGDLARQMLAIASGLGYSATLTTGRNRPGPDARARGENQQVRDWFRVTVSEYGGHYSQPRPAGRFIERQITSIERIPYSGPVFDLTVDVDHTFVASGVTVSNCHYNDEGTLLTRLIDGAVEVSGSDPPEVKEERLAAFARGEIRVLVTKPRIASWGLNYQNCHRMTYFPDHSFEAMYQAVRRCWRFGQREPVAVDVITTPGGVRVLANLERKAEQADRMFSSLTQHMREAQAVDRSHAYDQEAEVPRWAKS